MPMDYACYETVVRIDSQSLFSFVFRKKFVILICLDSSSRILYWPRGDQLANILIVIGDDKDRLLLCGILEQEGHDVVSESYGERAFDQLTNEPADLLMADVRLADMTGLEITRRVKSTLKLNKVRVILVADNADPALMAEALENGADDYLARPFQPEVLVARVNATLRRPAALAPDSLVQVGPIRLTKASHMIQIDDQELRLSPVEFRLMAFFMENPGRVHDRQELLAKVWRRKNGICERTVDVHVRRLRASLEPHNCEHMLKTVRGFGYRFG